jgi:hypothetical protein
LTSLLTRLGDGACGRRTDIAVGKEKSFKEFFGLVKSLARDDVRSVAKTDQAWNDKDVAMHKKIEETQVRPSLSANRNVVVWCHGVVLWWARGVWWGGGQGSRGGSGS